MKTHGFLLIFIFACLFGSELSAQKKVYVKVFENDCTNCYAGSMYLARLEEDMPVYLVFKEKTSDKEVDIILKRYMNGLQGVKNVFIEKSDSLYHALGQENILSEVIAKDDDKELGRWMLHAFKGDIPKGGAPALPAEVSFPDSVSFKNAYIALSDKYLTIVDPFFEQIYMLDKKTLEPVFSLSDPAAFEALPLVEEFDLCPVPLYKQQMSQTAGYGFDRVKLPYCQNLHNGGGWVPININIPIIDNELRLSDLADLPDLPEAVREELAKIQKTDNESVQVVANVPYTGFWKIDPAGKTRRYIPLKGFEHNKIKHTGEDVSMQLMYSTDDGIIMDLRQAEEGRGFLAKFAYTPDSVYLSKHYPFTYPPGYAKKLDGYMFSNIMAYPYVITQFSNELWNVESGETRRLPLVQSKLMYDKEKFKLDFGYKILDAVVAANGATLRLLVWESHDNGDKCLLRDIDLKSLKQTAVQNIELRSGSGMQSQLRFLNPDYLVYLHNDKLVVHKLK
ncbi:MAG: hypothetical protein LBL90_06575 [Prevotellaceae bacterium]|jgi:hypothetical protein|nr:hypothetical protein [Prevotellaceae bacterium]